MSTHIVVGLSSDEFGRGSDRPVKYFDSEAKCIDYLKKFNGDTSRLEVYEVKPLVFTIELKAKDE